MKVRDNSKCREWERRRRDRLADAFKLLVELLPNYDPAKIPVRIEILENATQFIKELRLSNSRLAADHNQPSEMVKKVKHLQDEVNKLILRVKQLTALLVKAKITIPNGPSIKSLGKKRFKWSNKLGVRDIQRIQISKTTPICEVSKNGPATLQNDRLGKTKITIVDRIEGMEIPPKQSPPIDQPARSSTETANVTSNPANQSTSPPVHQVQQQPTFIFTPIQIQPQLITRVNLAAPLSQCQPILSKVIVGPSSFPKIPIKSITKRVPRKIRKPSLKPKRLKSGNDKVEFGTQTSTTSFTDTSAEPKDNTHLESDPQSIDQAVHDNVNADFPLNDKEFSSGSVATESVITIKENLISCVEESLAKSEEPTPNPTSIQIQNDSRLESIPQEGPKDIAEMNHLCENKDIEDNVVAAGTSSSETMISNTDRIIANATDSSQNGNTKTDELPENANSQVSQPELSTSTFTSSSLISSADKSLLNVEVDNTVCTIPSSSTHEQSPTPMSSVPVTRVVDFDMDLNESRRATPLAPISTPEVNHPVSLDTEKMSECIARSIGLMEEGSEETEAELMELGTDWGDVVGHSPKSPISPTQMFLSMFPLLPRESLVAVPVQMEQSGQTQDSNPHSQATSQQKSCRSSFFIDSMLPGSHQQHATPVLNFDSCDTTGKSKRSLGDGDSLDTILAPLQPLSREKRSSEILSLSAFLHSEDAFGLEPISTNERSSGKNSVAMQPTALPTIPATNASQGQPFTYSSPEAPQTNSAGNSGVFQNPTQSYDLFFPSYTQRKANEAIPSSSYLQNHFTHPTTSQCGVSGPTQDLTYTFRHKYVETGLENTFPQNQRYDNQNHQKKYPPPVSHHTKTRNKTSVVSASQSETRTGSSKFSGPKAQSTPRDADPSPFRYFQQPNAQFRTNSSEQRTESANCLNPSNLASNPTIVSRPQHSVPNSQIAAPPTSSHFYSAHFHNTPSSTTVADKTSYERLGRPFYAPPLVNDAPTPPFYLAPPHCLQPQHIQSSQLQFQNEGFCNAGQSRSYHDGNHAYIHPQPSSRSATTSTTNTGQHSANPHPQRVNQSAPTKRNIEQKKAFTAQAQGTTQSQAQQQRPVNWMTDSAYKKGNEFSVSKLVGVQNTTEGDAIIRQHRNPWGDVQFDSNTQNKSSAYGHVQTHAKPYAPPLPQSHGLVESYNQRGHHGPNEYHSQHHNYFNPTHHQPHQPYLSGPTSNSISNFNLSSIFPEINDKQQAKGVCPTYYGSSGNK